MQKKIVYDPAIHVPILIDASYLIFYRYHALTAWWKYAKMDAPVGTSPIEQPLFVEKFKTACIKFLTEVAKNLGVPVLGGVPVPPTGRKRKGQGQGVTPVPVPLIIIAKDCMRERIWRTALYPEYKSTRASMPEFYPFFDLFYSEIIPEVQKTMTLCSVVEHPHFEADDCIATCVTHLLGARKGKGDCDKGDMGKMYIIASDKDYLQLADERVNIRTANFKDITEKASSTKDKECDLFCKILLGDKSDNIPGIFKDTGIKCGEKSVLAYFQNPAKLNTLLADMPNIAKAYERNRQLVDFRHIPVTYRDEFLGTFF